MNRHRFISAMMVGVGLLGSAMVLPAMAQLRGEEPGSLLIFPEFDITPPAVTQIRVTDVRDPALGGTTRVRFQYICPGVPGVPGFPRVCPTIDRHKFLTFHGTLVVDVATDLGLGGPFPCNNGYLVAFVEDANHNPISSNSLIGSYRITDVDDQEATNAIAVQSARPPGTVLGSVDATGEVVLTFGSSQGATTCSKKPPKTCTTTGAADYVALPDTLHSDFQAVDLAAPKTAELIVLTPTVKAGLANPEASLAVHWWNQFEDEFSSTRQFTCWAKVPLQTISASFLALNLGSPIGSVRVESVTTGDYSPAILGVIRETGPGVTLRRMYHTGAIATTFGPGP
jgi:hypothetical protein